MKKFMSVLTAVAVAAMFTTVALAADEGAPKAVKAKSHQFTGEITKVDAAAGSLDVKNSKDDTKTFKTDAKTKVVTADKKDATVADLKVGDKVTVIADEAGLAIKIGPAKTPAPKKEGKKEAAPKE